MELTLTLFIKFALGIYIILDLFIIKLKITKGIVKFGFRKYVNFSQQFFSYASFLFSKPKRRLC